MESNNWLEPPVWGSSSEEGTVDGLSRTFETLGRDILNNEDQEDPLEHNAWGSATTPNIQAELTKGLRVGVADTGGDRDDDLRPPVEGEILHSQQLLSSLAPEKDPLQGLVAANSVRSPTKGDPLFMGFGNSPIAVEEFDSKNSANALRGTTTPTKKHGKVQRLFSTKMLRRTPLTEEQENDLIVDPLGDLSQQSAEQEFVDEPLEESVFDSKLNLLQQMEAPLFEASQSKPRLTQQLQLVADPPRQLHRKLQSLSQQKDQQEASSNVFEIEVVDPIKVADLTFSHVEYTVHTKSSSLEPSEVTVKRRYRDFRWLYRQLQSNHWGRIIPPPPDKQTVGRFKQDFIENRRFQMERMLKKIGQNTIFQKDEDFIMFLTSSNFSQDSKVREHLTGSRAVNDSSDLSEIHISELKLLGPEDAETVIKNGGLDSDSNSTFMRISFSSPPRYTEPDSYFVERRQQADILEEQLKQMYKSLELVDSQKNELVSVIKEFAATLKALVDLEASKKISDLLSNFSEVHRRIMESVQRTSLQDSLTLGITIDEYLRSLGSIKAIFNQRSKLGYYLVLVESDRVKKQAQLQKLTNNMKSPPDKIEATKQELFALQRRQQVIKEHWDQIAEVMRDELTNYYDAKIADFRNNMEIYLESAIETQKECIELWETFYQNNL
ncbi:sorting nexin 1 Ecym_4050 [Eremothecium cymbalariae DBVPG|uniref:PX domain-containing protein n=1 Tax=Eremothecium cymbalariae (strain CBS 270.75 / DBVPG 7215 / KCTC 17166 / NRRL Y-17582) TaxID=931890 RepID=G8JSX8_ERECY|nr:hypothetical protein Ecym_4050 [Eremothecium cymbalariae DBVPG\